MKITIGTVLFSKNYECEKKSYLNTLTGVEQFDLKQIKDL